MLISIIMPTYNRADTLPRAINSVLNQTYTHWELLVIDNYSVDDTDRIIKNYNNSKITLLKINNYGIIAKSRNLGIHKSNGDIIAFLDSDDWWCYNKLQISIEEMEHCNADFIFHKTRRVKKNRFITRTSKVKFTDVNIFNSLIVSGNYIINSSVVVKKKLLIQIGYLSEDLETRTWEDYDAWLKIAKISNKFHYIDRVLGCIWIGNSNEYEISNKILDSFENKYESEISNIGLSTGIWWVNYNRAYVSFLQGSMDDSLKYLIRINYSQIPYIITKIKIYILSLLCIVLKLKIFRHNKHSIISILKNYL